MLFIGTKKRLFDTIIFTIIFTTNDSNVSYSTSQRFLFDRLNAVITKHIFIGFCSGHKSMSFIRLL